MACRSLFHLYRFCVEDPVVNSILRGTYDARAYGLDPYVQLLIEQFKQTD